jgi:hypothetical protein
MILSSSLRDSEIADIASCSKRTVTRVRANVRAFGELVMLPTARVSPTMSLIVLTWPAETTHGPTEGSKNGWNPC